MNALGCQKNKAKTNPIKANNGYQNWSKNGFFSAENQRFAPKISPKKPVFFKKSPTLKNQFFISSTIFLLFQATLICPPNSRQMLSRLRYLLCYGAASVG